MTKPEPQAVHRLTWVGTRGPHVHDFPTAGERTRFIDRNLRLLHQARVVEFWSDNPAWNRELLGDEPNPDAWADVVPDLTRLVDAHPEPPDPDETDWGLIEGVRLLDMGGWLEGVLPTGELIELKRSGLDWRGLLLTPSLGIGTGTRVHALTRQRCVRKLRAVVEERKAEAKRRDRHERAKQDYLALHPPINDGPLLITTPDGSISQNIERYLLDTPAGSPEEQHEAVAALLAPFGTTPDDTWPQMVQKVQAHLAQEQAEIIQNHWGGLIIENADPRLLGIIRGDIDLTAPYVEQDQLIIPGCPNPGWVRFEDVTDLEDQRRNDRRYRITIRPPRVTGPAPEPQEPNP